MSRAPSHEEEAELFIRMGGLYEKPGGSSKLFRVIVVDEVNRVLVVKTVSMKWDKVERAAMEVSLTDWMELAQRKKLIRHEECICPEFLLHSDEELRLTSTTSGPKTEQWLKKRDVDYALIEELVDVPDGVVNRSAARAERLLLTFSKRTHAASVNAQALAKNVKPIVIRRLLHRFVWFGMTKNAMLSRDAFKGTSDKNFRFSKTKTGRPNSAVVIGRDSQNAGRNVTQKDIHIFTEVLETVYVRGDMNLMRTYDEMKNRYMQENQHGVSKIRRSRIPTWGQFRYHARKIVTLLKMKADKAGDKDGKELLERRGYDTDISGGVGQVYDTDATPFNKELVCRYKVNGKPFNIGKCTVLLVFDRDSKKCVGWHLYIGNENWKEGYRLAMFCAMTSKKHHLERLGIDDADAFPENENIIPAYYYVDRGPGSAKSAQEALERLRIDFAIAPPDTPYWKPTVEGGLGHAQEDQAPSPGAYRRTNRARDKDAKRNAKLTASHTTAETEKAVVEGIIKWNRALNKVHLLTDEMKTQGVAPSSQAIFSWGLKKMGGAQNRQRSEAAIYTALLDHKFNVEVTVDGVALLGARYQSARLRRYREVEGRNIKVTVMYHPLRTGEAYWVTPDGVLDKLVRDEKGNRDYGVSSAHDIDRYTLELAALEIELGDKRPRKPALVSRRQRDQMLEASGLRPTPQRKRATANEQGARKLEKALEDAHRQFDRPEFHAPNVFNLPTPGASPEMTVDHDRHTPSKAPSLGDAVGPMLGLVDTVALFRLRQQKKREEEGKDEQ